jgi:hypothetical protein
LARDRGSGTPGGRTEEERVRAREERERRRVAKTASAQPIPQSEDGPPLPPPSAAEPSFPQVVEEPPAAKSRAVEPYAGEPHAGEPPAGEQFTEGRSVVQRSPQSESARSELEPPESELGDPTMTEEVSPRYPLPLPPAALDSRRPAGLYKQQQTPPHRSRLHRPHRPHLHRPQMHRPHISSARRGAARVFALFGLVLVLAVIAGGVALLTRHSNPPKPPPAPRIVKVVIPEGYTRLQIAALAHADGLRGSYLAASKRSAELHPSHYGAPAGTPNLEGFLFPATYEMYVGALVGQLASEQLAAFRENFGGGEVHRAKTLGITPYELLIVASIIEREAAIPHDRPLVAAVIYNRLRLHMTLGIDSTLRYALHDFTHPLTEAQLASASPYNTRIHEGLPPTPISNPGDAAITAATRPAHVSYLYYVAGADGCGEQLFSTSFSQFEKNAAAYHEAIEKNGGRVPTCKKK